MLPKDHPQEHRPGNDRVKEPLDGARAPAVASPACDPHHGDPTGHGPHGHDDTAQLTDGRGMEVRTATMVRAPAYRAWVGSVVGLSGRP